MEKTDKALLERSSQTKGGPGTEHGIRERQVHRRMHRTEGAQRAGAET